jgi:hypothetical protein
MGALTRDQLLPSQCAINAGRIPETSCVAPMAQQSDRPTQLTPVRKFWDLLEFGEGTMDQDPPLHFSISVALSPPTLAAVPTAQHLDLEGQTTLTRVLWKASLGLGELTNDQDFPFHRSTSGKPTPLLPVKYCPTAQQREREAQLTPISAP